MKTYKETYTVAKENSINPTMLYVYDNVICTLENENVKLTDEEVEKVCEFINKCIITDDVSVYALARYFAVLLNDGETLEDLIKDSANHFVQETIRFIS